MKKMLQITAIMAMVLLSAAACYADSQGTVNVTVTIDQTISIAIAGGPVNFGNLGVNQIAVSSASISITNDGSGADEMISLTVTDPPGWSRGTPGAETYNISFLFSGTQPQAGDAGWLDADAVSEPITYNETKDLWVKLQTPTSTSVTTQQNIQVTITAQ